MSKPTCKAIVQDGPRKGQNCIPLTTIDSEGYCARHQRQKEYDLRIAQGKRLCRMFFRGCNSEISATQKTCEDCRKKNKRPTCIHVYESGKQCTYEILNEQSKYCGKHQRDAYRELEQTQNMKLCNVERGCMNVCDPEYESCKSCIINDYIVNDRYYSEKLENHNICIVCEALYSSSVLCDALKRCEECSTEFMNARKIKKVVQQRAYSDMSIEKYYETYMKGSCTRSYDCEFSLSLKEFAGLVQKACYYCNDKDEHTFNGIDRVNNNLGYTSDNSVPCCSPCNRMKHAMTIEEFINKCNAIHTFITTNRSITNDLMHLFPNYKTMSIKYYSDYKKGNGEDSDRKLEFTLTKDEYNAIRAQACYLCGAKNGEDHYNGIDRIDNAKGYILSNCKPCCGHCNFLKAMIPVGIVKAYASKIATNESLYSYIVDVEDDSDSNSIVSSDEKSTESFSTKYLTELIQISLDDAVKYCRLHKRSDAYILKVQQIYERKEILTKEDIHIELLRCGNTERKKSHYIKDINCKARHKKSSEVVSMLSQNKLNEYLIWHTEHIGEPSDLFRSSLEDFIKDFPRLSVQEKIELCKRIIRQEQYRRHYKKTSEKLKTNITNISKLNEKLTEPIKQTKPFQVVNVHSIMPERGYIEHVLPEFTTPKQWKTSIIYDYIQNNQEHIYKQYCEENNSIKDMPWETMWSTFLTQVKGHTKEVAEPIIHAFVEDLRRRRHNALCAKKQTPKILEREDRKVWPAETIAKLYTSGRITEYKGIAEEAYGEDPTNIKWLERWETFVGKLKSQQNEKDLISTISKFMASQRTYKYKRTKLTDNKT